MIVNTGIRRRQAPQPSLYLNFAQSGSLAGRGVTLTGTRASAQTYFDSTGTMQSAANDVMAYDYNPPTLAALGLSLWEARTNLCLQSEDLTTSWTPTRASISANATAAPNGLVTADKLVEDSTAASTHIVASADQNLSTATVYTYTVFAKAAGRTAFNMQIGTGVGAYGAVVPFCYFDLSSVSIASSGSGVGSIQTLPNGWFRCSFVAIATTSASTTNMRLKLAIGASDSYSGDGSSGMYLWGAGVEAGAFITPYIATAGASATRALFADSTTTLTWQGATENTYTVSGTKSVVSSAGVLFQLDDGTENNRITLSVNASAQATLTVVTGGVSQAAINAGTVTANTSFKCAFRIKNNDIAVSLNGAVVVADTTTPNGLPTVTTLRYGRDSAGTNVVNGWIATSSGYPRGLPDGTLQGLST